MLRQSLDFFLLAVYTARSTRAGTASADPRPAPPRPPALYAPWRIRSLRTLRAQKVDHDASRTVIKKLSGAYPSSRQDTDYTGGGGSQVLTGAVDYERYGLPDTDVCTRRSEGRYVWSGPQGPRDHVLRVVRSLRGLRRAMVEGSRSGAVRSMIRWRNVQLNAARIARTVFNMVICRTFMRSVLTVIFTRVGALSPASHR